MYTYMYCQQGVLIITIVVTIKSVLFNLRISITYHNCLQIEFTLNWNQPLVILIISINLICVMIPRAPWRGLNTSITRFCEHDDESVKLMKVLRENKYQSGGGVIVSVSKGRNPRRLQPLTTDLTDSKNTLKIQTMEEIQKYWTSIYNRCSIETLW